MSIDASYAAALRPEPEHAWEWGLYCPRRDRWAEATFASRHEAEQALKVMSAAGPFPIA